MAPVSNTGLIAPLASPVPPVPRLEPGDRLTSAEFMRRYEAMPEVKKAELIEGVVYMPSPVRMDAHGQPHADLLTWLGTYRSETPGVLAGDNSTLKLDNENVPQPDALLMIDRQSGGQAALDSGGYIQGPPELGAEVASSSVSIDLNDKFRVYRRNGVREYIAWRVLDQAIDWFVLRGGHYLPLSAAEDGITRSEVFPGLWLDVRAMLAGKLDSVLAVLQQGIASPEHVEFANELARRRT
ncbi:MAG: Uma2 family endonuclease [Pirellulales bacterium]